MATKQVMINGKGRASFPVDYNYTRRDGLYEENQLYAIYERADVIKLVDRIKSALKESKPT